MIWGNGMKHQGLMLALLLACADALATDNATATAVDEPAMANAASTAWSKYATVSSQADASAAALIAASGLQHYAFLRDAALVASAEQIRRIPISDRVIVYALRATKRESELRALDGAGIARFCLAEGWCGIAAPNEGRKLPTLTHVTLITPDHAIGELGPPTGTQFQFGPELKLEQGGWKVATESTTWSDSLAIQQQIQRAGMSENEMLEFLLAEFLGKKHDIPPLAILDRPLVDDGAMRTRLNEGWPDYTSNFRTRIRAMEIKATEGDTLAQFGLGGMYYSGKPDGLITQDRANGLKWLELASDNGHALAAAAAAEALFTEERPAKGKAPSRTLMARIGRHLKRAAEGGIPSAMVMWGNHLFNGAGDTPRNCQLAEEWAARGEDAGVKHARNERVWYLAACPIPEQRDAKRALALAAHLMENADSLSGSELDTVAAALAANARFEEAQDYQIRAIAKLEEGDAQTRRRMKQRLELYKNRRDWVQDYDSYSLPVQ